MLKIDTHTHVFRTDLEMVAHRHYTPTSDASVDALRRNMDAADIDAAVLIQPSFLGTDNAFLLDALRSNPNWLRGVVVVEPDISAEAIAAMHALGVRGIRFNLVGRPTAPAKAPPQRPLLDRIRPLGWHVELHVDGLELAPLIAHFRDAEMPVVVDHFGRPALPAGVNDPGFQAMLARAGDSDLYCKMSAPYRLGGADPRPYADALLEALGPNQLLWASDWPWTQHEDRFDYGACLAWGLTWIRNDPAIAAAMNDAAARVFSFPRTGN